MASTSVSLALLAIISVFGCIQGESCCSADLFCEANNRQHDLETELHEAQSKITNLNTQISSLINRPVVLFAAYRTSSFTTLKSIITYNVLNINEGRGMNATSGIFRAPISGIYEFNFHGITNWGTVSTDSTRVRLMVNNVWKTLSHGEKGHTHTLAISTLLVLKAGDQVACYLETGGLLYDTPSDMLTQFTGQLLLAKK